MSKVKESPKDVTISSTSGSMTLAKNSPDPGIAVSTAFEDKPCIEIKETFVAAPADSASDLDESAEIDEKRLLRKIDWALLPWLSVLYLLSFLDRSSIGNAKLYGMEADLHITDAQYLVCLSVYYVPYALFEVPSNIFIKRLRPSIWLSTIMLLWGIMMTVQGLVHNYGGLFALRWMLGVFEAGFFPGAAYCLSCWYKRNELGFRFAIFNCANQLSGAFGGLLAAAISNMDGLGGKPAWAWIFILEGLVTVVAAIACFFLVQDFPDTARFLSSRERAFVIRRLQADDQFSASGEDMRWRNVWKSLVDWKTWMGTLLLMSPFLSPPQLGFSATPANLLTVPVYIVACVCTLSVGFMADRLGRRGYFNMFLYVVAALGYIILVFSRDGALSYFAVFLVAVGIFPTVPHPVSAWVSNNVEGSYKRSVTIAAIISFGNIQGAVSSNVYRERDTPWYTLGHGVMLAYIGIGFVSAIAFHVLLRRENARRDRGERDEIITGQGGDKCSGNARNGCYESVDAARRDKGDEWSGYRYML
ncbi:hypothetical protein M0805_008110 [Coniferiporia weirii]|nr:hypothetical protein M0805_008110 [Coniferiporia weirii]